MKNMNTVIYHFTLWLYLMWFKEIIKKKTVIQHRNSFLGLLMQNTRWSYKLIALSPWYGTKYSIHELQSFYWNIYTITIWLSILENLSQGLSFISDNKFFSMIKLWYPQTIKLKHCKSDFFDKWDQIWQSILPCSLYHNCKVY